MDLIALPHSISVLKLSYCSACDRKIINSNSGHVRACDAAMRYCPVLGPRTPGILTMLGRLLTVFSRPKYGHKIHPALGRALCRPSPVTFTLTRARPHVSRAFLPFSMRLLQVMRRLLIVALVALVAFEPSRSQLVDVHNDTWGGGEHHDEPLERFHVSISYGCRYRTACI